MPVPTYPSAISLNDIQTEFTGSNPIAINEYYSGGTYVGSGTANTTGTTIPTSGQISFLNFSGASNRLTWTLTAGTSAPKTGYRYFNYGSTTPELLSQAKVRSGSIIEIYTDGSILSMSISGITGAMVTQTNLFVNFSTDLVGVLAASSASFSSSGSAGNSTGTWWWSTATKFTSGSNYSQYLSF